MPVPNVSVSKNPFALAATSPSSDGVLAILASAAGGTQNQAGSYSNPNVLKAAFTGGPLVEYGAYDIDVSGRPVVAILPPTSVAATYGTITKSIAGTAVPVAGATAPLEHYAVQVTIVAGGALGTAGITYTYSLDGGNVVSAPQSLGTSLILTIPGSGVSFTLGTATQTLIVGDSFSCFTERALMNDADLAATLPVLANTRLPWEGVLLDAQIGAGTIGLVDTWLSGLEAQGQFHFALLNTRFKTEPAPTAETEAAYATAMTTVIGSQTSERVCVGADGGHMASVLTGLNLKRPTSLALAAMAMSLTPNIGIDPAYVSNGPAPNYQVSDGNSNPLDHDEGVYPTLDILRVATLRTFAAGGPQGVYITNANVISPGASNIQYLQHLRVLNKACSIAWQILTNQLSVGVATRVNPSTGALNIAEISAQRIEDLVNPTLESSLRGQVSAVKFTLARDDNLQANPPIVTGTVQVAALIYVKGFRVVVAMAKSITTPGA